MRSFSELVDGVEGSFGGPCRRTRRWMVLIAGQVEC